MWKFLVKNQSIEIMEREVLADHQIQYQKDANRQVPHPQRGCLLEVLLKRMEKRGNELAFLPAGHL